MKKSLILSLILSINLFAFTQDDAIKTYNEKDYEKSFNMFLQLLEEGDYQSIKNNFYFALSAEKIGEYNEAIAAYERILLYKPDSLRAKLEMGRIYFILKQYNVSKQYFNEALKETENKNVKKHIKVFLERIKKAEQTHFLNLVGMFGLGYDSNINNLTDENNYIIYFNNTPIDVNNSGKKTGAFSIQEALIVKDKYKFDNFSINNDFMIFNSNMLNHSDKDLQLFEYNPSLNYKNTKTALKYDYIYSGGEPYISQTGIELSLYNSFVHLSNNLNIGFSYKNYLLQKNDKRDSLNYSISDTIKKIANNKLYYLSLNFHQERKTKGKLTTVDNNSIGFVVGENYKFSPTFNINPSFGYTKTLYNDKDAFFQKKREDKKMVIGLKMNNNFNSFGVQTNIQYLKNNSNIEPYKYNKWLMNLSFIKQFKGL